MADLIDRCAVLSDINEEIEANQEFPEDKLIRKGLRIARKFIENASTVNRWIPVEDALPEKAGNYLCTLFYTIPPYNLFHPEKDTYIRETSVKFFDGKSFIASVVAWMPMPDAYEPPESEVQE